MKLRSCLVAALVATTAASGLQAARGAEPKAPALEPSVRDFLGTSEIDVPERSQAFPNRSEARARCGSLPRGTRFRLDGDLRDWSGSPTWINGTGRYDRGEFIWTDYPFDDAGTGQLRYPGEGEDMTGRPGSVAAVSPRMLRYGSNAADLVEVRFSADDRYFYVTGTLNFLNDLDSTVVGFGFDVDSSAPGLTEWPRGARLKSDGVDVFVTVAGGCGWLTSSDGETAIDESGGAVAVDAADNSYEVAIPRGLLGASGPLRVVGGSGLWNPSTGTWMTPVTGGAAKNATDTPTGARTTTDPAVFNLLFRTEPMIDANDVLDTGNSTSSKRVFQTRRQEEILATGTTADAALELDPSRLGRGASSDPLIARPGEGVVDFTRSYRSRIDLEGVLSVGSQLVYLSRHQPYAVHVPEGVAPGRPLSVMFHGGDGSHVNELSEEAGLRVAAKLDAKVGAVTMSPLGRGRRQPWWRGLGEADVLEAIDAVERAYRTDPGRRLANGASLGGYATIRLSSLYPDLWAGAVASCPATYENSTSSRALGNELPSTQGFVVDPVMPSLLNVPYRQISGTGDPLVRIDSGHRIRDAALAAQLDVGYTEYPNSSHCFLVPSIAGGWMDNHTPEMAMLLEAGRKQDPARVRYAVDPRHYPAGAEVIGIADVRDIGLGYRSAYWLSGIRVREEVEQRATTTPTSAGGNSVGGPGTDVVAMVDAVSHARPGWQLATKSCGESIGLAGSGSGGNPYAEADSGGSTGVTWNNPNYWRCQAQSWTGDVEGVLELTTRHVAEVTVDSSAAGLHSGAPLRLRARGDGPTTVTLSDRQLRSASGPCVEAAEVVPAGLRLRLTLAAAECTVSVGR